MKSTNPLAELPGLEGNPNCYFIRRELTKEPDFEEAYWGRVVDPDGVVRDRANEREKFLTNLKHEVEFLTSHAPGRILDIGCGLGFLLSVLDDRWERHGLEVSAFAAGHARQWGKIFTGDLCEAQYPSDWFDVIVMHHVIEHLPDPAKAITEIFRILRPGGTLLLGTPDFDSGCARLFGGNYRLLADPTHISLFSNDSMHRFLRDFGFVIDYVDYPFFDTPYFNEQNLARLSNKDAISPPFYGNFMTFYAHKANAGPARSALLGLCRAASQMAELLERGGDASELELAEALRRTNLFPNPDDNQLNKFHALLTAYLDDLTTQISAETSRQ